MAEPRPRRWLEYALAAAVAAGIAWGGWGMWRDRQLAERLELIPIGMDGKSAEAILGRPDWTGPCGARIASCPAKAASRTGYARPSPSFSPTLSLPARATPGLEAEAIAAP